MAIEEHITQMTKALEANTAALKEWKKAAAPPGTAGTAATATTGKPDGKKPAIDFEQVKVAGGKVVEKHGKPFAKKMIQDVGGAKELAAVKAEKYPALFKAFEGALAENADEPETEAEEDEL